MSADKNVNSWSADALQPLTLTDSAIAHVQKYLDQRGQGAGLRVGVKPSGCNGYQYISDLVDEPEPTDRCFPVSGTSFSLYVDSGSFPLIAGTQIDFVHKDLGGTLVFNNPNESASCGCGESFSIDQPQDGMS